MCMGCDERDAEYKWCQLNRVEDVYLHLIRNTQQRAEDGGFLWWSTRVPRPASNSAVETAMILEPGWSSLANATVFDSEDATDLPPGGEWVQFEAQVKTLNDAVPSPLPEYAGLVNRTILTLTLDEKGQRERTETVVENDSDPLDIHVTDLRGQMSQYGEPKIMNYLCIYGTDNDAVRARFAELTA